MILDSVYGRKQFWVEQVGSNWVKGLRPSWFVIIFVKIFFSLRVYLTKKS